MKSQQKYWDKKITEWSEVSYGKKTLSASLIEKLATPFRGADKRVRITLTLLGPLVSGKTVLFLGCGVGNECFDLFKYKPKKIIGIDISSVAIGEARKAAKKKSATKRFVFMVEDVGTIDKLPAADYVIGLGFIDYLNTSELTNLFRLVSKQNFFFSFFEKKTSLFNLIHEIYVKSQGCPGAFKYTRDQIGAMMPKNSRHFFIKKGGMLFLTNIEKLK